MMWDLLWTVVSPLVQLNYEITCPKELIILSVTGRFLLLSFWKIKKFNGPKPIFIYYRWISISVVLGSGIVNIRSIFIELNGLLQSATIPNFRRIIPIVSFGTIPLWVETVRNRHMQFININLFPLSSGARERSEQCGASEWVSRCKSEWPSTQFHILSTYCGLHSVEGGGQKREHDLIARRL